MAFAANNLLPLATIDVNKTICWHIFPYTLFVWEEYALFSKQTGRTTLSLAIPIYLTRMSCITIMTSWPCSRVQSTHVEAILHTHMACCLILFNNNQCKSLQIILEIFENTTFVRSSFWTILSKEAGYANLSIFSMFCFLMFSEISCLTALFD